MMATISDVVLRVVTLALSGEPTRRLTLGDILRVNWPCNAQTVQVVKLSSLKAICRP
jgi:hypothetical protein